MRVGQVQHRAKGVKHQSLDAVRDEQPLLLAEQRHHGTVTQQLALTVGQQGTPGAARGGAAGGKLGGVKGVGVAVSPPPWAVNWASTLYTLPLSALMGASAMV